MIKNYGIYNYHEYNNTLLIKFSDLPVNKKVTNGEVTILFHDEQKVGYIINDFIKYAKIKYSGIIFLPADPLIDVINSVLKKYKLESLDYKKYSGFVTKKCGNSTMIFANSGTFLRDESISLGKFCTYYDLYIKHENENELIVINEDVKENIDFFKMEVK